MTSTFSLPRAPLFVPGDKPSLFAKAAVSDADAIIIDLEDAVAPAAKETARTAILSHGVTAVPVIVRINAAGTVWHGEDLAVLASANIAAVMLPKAESCAVIETCGHTHPVIALIESAAGLAGLSNLAGASGLAGFAFGSLDYALDLDCQPDWEPLLGARSELVLRSRLAGLPGPIDGVTPDLSDPEAAGRDAARARALGFKGKLAIHPKQVTPLLAAMRPTADEIAWAERIVAVAGHAAVASVDGAMVDAPVIARARRILDAR